jgi:hypothetical protein
MQPLGLTGRPYSATRQCDVDQSRLDRTASSECALVNNSVRQHHLAYAMQLAVLECALVHRAIRPFPPTLPVQLTILECALL